MESAIRRFMSFQIRVLFKWPHLVLWLNLMYLISELSLNFISVLFLCQKCSSNRRASIFALGLFFGLTSLI